MLIARFPVGWVENKRVSVLVLTPAVLTFVSAWEPGWQSSLV